MFTLPKWSRPSQWSRKKRLKVFGTLGIIVLAILFFLPPVRFPAGEVIRIKSGLSVGEAAQRLSDQHIVRSPSIFKILMLGLAGNDGLVAGDYLLSHPMTVFEVVYRLSRGAYGMKATRVTIPEGSTNQEIASILSKNLRQISASKFIELAKDKQGYLFPDTYFFLPTATEADILETMENSFTRQIVIIQPQISRSRKNLAEVIIMASILEKELKPGKDRQIAAGILWKRLDDGMKLQVDVAKETYKKEGLPLQPIASPGLDAIKAAVDPIESPYWFYLSGKDGKTHFAITHDEHVANKKKYL